MDKIKIFMYIYMYELEQFLLNRKKEIAVISFQSDEANTDRPLKEYLQKVIEKEFKLIFNCSKFTTLNYQSISLPLKEINKIKIKRVLLPEEITNNIKEILKKSKNSIYTNPDICLEIVSDGKIYYETIELKSTKTDSIPGSSIQQIFPNEWVIFVKHFKEDVDIVTGQYINSINSKIQFPDRSPRPQVSFNVLKKWNLEHRKILDTKLIYLEDIYQLEKSKLLQDWQGVLSSRWIDMLFNSQTIKLNEPWFNNNMRRFILEFIEKYELLSEEEKIKFKENIKILLRKRD